MALGTVFGKVVNFWGSVGIPDTFLRLSIGPMHKPEVVGLRYNDVFLLLSKDIICVIFGITLEQ